jgi:hypothetical protein
MATSFGSAASKAYRALRVANSGSVNVVCQAAISRLKCGSGRVTVERACTTPGVASGLAALAQQKLDMNAASCKSPAKARKPRKPAKAKAASRAGCILAGLKANGRLRKGFRWRKGRKKCPMHVKKH